MPRFGTCPVLEGLTLEEWLEELAAALDAVAARAVEDTQADWDNRADVVRAARDEIARLRGERDEWKRAAEERAEQAEARVAALEGALRQVEWCDVDGSVFCPWCEVSGFNGCVEHALDCPRQAALSAPGQPEGER
jgi:alkylation response protein AidB-like acyl-CoA dehydrogenase